MRCRLPKSRQRSPDKCLAKAVPIDNEKSLAFIGSAGAAKQNRAEIFTALSITRLEGSRWCLRRTRQVMEKVRKCGLMFLQEETRQD
jgi:hypothetical protein